MSPKDAALLEKSQAALAQLKISYDTPIQWQKTVLGESDLQIKILAFENIADACEVTVDESTLEEITYYLKMVYYMDILQVDSQAIREKLLSIENSFLEVTYQGKKVDYRQLRILRDDLHLIQSVYEAIKLRIKQLHSGYFWQTWRYRPLFKMYDEILAALQEIESSIYSYYEFASTVLTDHITDNFAYIYTFFAYMIRYLLQTKQHLLVLEFLSTVEQVNQAMQPLSSKIKLKRDHLRNAYGAYKLQKLIESIEIYF